MPAPFPLITRTYTGLLDVLEKSQPEAVFRIPRVQDKIVALTIDDSPSPHTPEILDVLRQHNSRATFFPHTGPLERTGSGRAFVELLLERGHEIANHMPEDRSSILLSAGEFAIEFQQAHERLTSWGATPRLFRPARGFYDAKRMLPSLKRLGYCERFMLASYFPWDVFFHHPLGYARRLAQCAFPGAIFVLHDGPGRAQRTLETLRLLLPLLTSRGYAVEPVGPLLLPAA